MFRFRNGKRITKAQQTEGNIPYITGGSKNNGITEYIGNPAFTERNIITFNFFGEVYYQPDEVGFKDGTYSMTLLDSVYMNKEISLYVVSILSKIFKQIPNGYDMWITPNRVEKIEIELPILTPEDTTPYWDYIAYFIYNIQQQYADQLEAKSEYELNLMCQIQGVTREEIAQRVEFTQPQYTNTFKVGDLFGVKSIKQVPSGFTPNFVADGIPYLSQKTGGSYGVNGYLNPEDVDGELELITEGMIVTGVDNVANGVMYWWDEPFYANKMVGLTHKYLDKWTAQYIITLLLKQYSGYDYNNKISISVIKDTEIELPVLASNSKQIDWGAIRNVSILGGINYLATRMEISNRDFAIIRQLIQ